MSTGPTGKITGDVSIVVCGEAGQGIQTIEQLLTHIAKLSGFNVFATKEYMSRIRGGCNSTEIRISSRKIGAYVERMDLLIPLSVSALPHLQHRVTGDTLILGEKSRLESDLDITDIPFSTIAAEIGGKIYAGTVAAGVILGILGVDTRIVRDYFPKRFASKGTDIIQKNVEAAERGYELGKDLLGSEVVSLDIKTGNNSEDELLLSGSEAVAFGAIAGGCNLVSSYPMSPGTGVLTVLAQHSHEFGTVVEQAEDEIAAINMALGAWYAGARALVTTSGGGFALMTEGMSLSGMIETPVVVHLAQRPGPATGLPTRTEQGDLELALYAGHGEFPRVIFAPGTPEQAFDLAREAFNVADKFQVPVIILTDQHLMDSYLNIPRIDLSGIRNESHIVKTGRAYRRFELTESGMSPRGIPGYGEGIVCVDSDEHTEEGYITEDLDLRTRMVDKRLRKLDAIKGQCVPPEFVGTDDFRTLVVCWGSTYHAVREALAALDRTDLAMLHFSQVYPLHPDAGRYFEKAERTVVIENNATAQFGKLLQLHAGVNVDHKILKYNGMPFSVEETIREIGKLSAQVDTP